MIGLPGTNNGTREDRTSPASGSMAAGTNPVKTSIPCFLFTDAIDHGTEMTAKNAGVKNADALKVNIKYMINYAGNCLTNQHSDTTSWPTRASASSSWASTRSCATR